MAGSGVWDDLEQIVIEPFIREDRRQITPTLKRLHAASNLTWVQRYSRGPCTQIEVEATGMGGRADEVEEITRKTRTKVAQ